MLPLVLIAFVSAMGFSEILPTLPYTQEAFHLSWGVVGIFSAIFPLANSFGSLMLGVLSDRYSRRKLLLASTTTLMIGYFLNGYIYYHLTPTNLTTNFHYMEILRFLMGFMSGNIVVSFSTVAHFSSLENRRKYMIYLTASNSIGLMLGPSIGGIVLYIFNNPGAVYFFSSAINLIAFSLVIIKFRNPPHRNNLEDLYVTKKQSVFDLIFTQFKNTKFVIILFLGFIFFINFSGLQVFAITEKFTHELKLSSYLVGTLWTVISCFSTIFQLTITKRFNAIPSLITGFCIFGIASIFMIFSNTVFLTALNLMIFSLGIALISPNIVSTVSKAGNLNNQGTLLGINQMFSNMGRTIGPVTVENVFSTYGNSAFVWLIISFLSIVQLVVSVYYFYIKKLNKSM